MKTTIIIAGAGAAGLMAAYELCKKGFYVIVTEAMERTGGRIHTLYNSFYNINPQELGAEFMHGKLPVTLGLLKEANLSFEIVKGEMYRIREGKWLKQEEMVEGWDELFEKMKSLENDLSLHDFLIRYFSDDRYESLRQSVKTFAQGFDLADPAYVSTISLLNEWRNDPEKQYRIKGGYRLLIDYLEETILQKGGQLLTNCRITEIKWSDNHVIAHTSDNRTIQGEAIILTMPLPILQKGELSFFPPIPHIQTEAGKIGWGKIIKFNLKFTESLGGKDDTGFIFSEETVPTWWTQFSGDTSHLTGWLGGPEVEKYEQASENELLHLAIQSLSGIFNLPIEAISLKLKAYVITNWGKIPSIAGGYSYDTPQSLEAKNILRAPIEDTIFLAGEAIYIGTSKGTVEAALTTGKEAAERLIKSSVSH
jgi:monoamine oxidase